MRRPMVLGAFVAMVVTAGCAAKERETGANAEGGAGGSAGGEGGAGATAGVENGGSSGAGVGGDAGASPSGGQGGMGGIAGFGAGATGSGGTSGMGAGAVSGAGGAPECTPAETEPCYGGPTSSEGVGQCRAGTRTCTTASTWGSCQGQVLPGVESCADSSVDENCDGFECGIWGTSFAGLDVRRVRGTADGAVLMGTFSSASIGGKTYTAQGSTDVALVKLGMEGEVEWVKIFGGSGSDSSWSLAIGPNREVYSVVHYSEVVGGQTVNVRKLEAVDGSGESRWSKTLPEAYWSGLAVSPQGNVVLSGSGDTVTIDGTTVSGNADVLVAQLHADGTLDWAKVIPNSGNEVGYFAETDGSGNIIVVGTLDVPVDFGGGQQQVYGGGDVFVLRLSSAGAYLSSRVFGGVGYDEPTGVAVDSAGGVVVMGFFDSDLKGLGFTVKSLVPTDQTFILHLSPTGSSLAADWGSVAPNVDTTGAIMGISAAADGGAVIVGRTYNGAGFDGQTFPGDVGLLIAMDNFGKHRWHRVLGGPSGGALGLGRSPNDELTVAGKTGSATIDLGSGAIQAGASRSYVARVGR